MGAAWSKQENGQFDHQREDGPNAESTTSDSKVPGKRLTIYCVTLRLDFGATGFTREDVSTYTDCSGGGHSTARLLDVIQRSCGALDLRNARDQIQRLGAFRQRKRPL
jgi:hypothetical protein